MALNNKELKSLFLSCLRSAPEEQFKSILKAGLSLDHESRISFDEMVTFWLDCKDLDAVQEEPIALVLLHGIRTGAEWQSVLEFEFKNYPHVTVVKSRYKWLNAFKFWMPVWWRKSPRETVARTLRYAQQSNPGAKLIVVAHSFSTYLLSKILEEETDIVPEKIVLCGSIVDADFRWDKVLGSNAKNNVINDVGVRDYWPLIAHVLSWGYGCSGVCGFNSPIIKNRFFNYGHSDVLKVDHIREHWMPFLLKGEISHSDWEVQRPTQPWWIGFTSGLRRPKLTFLALVLILFAVVNLALMVWPLWFGKR